jgi:rhodanese-related sulfurtransferase
MTKLIKLLSLAILVFPVLSLAEGGYKEINADELKDMISNDKIVLIDSRSSRYIEDGKIIEGAKVLSAQDMSEEALSKIASKEDKVVFYCSNTDCPASAKAAKKAESFGYKNLYKYPGGYDDWVAKGFPTENI